MAERTLSSDETLLLASKKGFSSEGSRLLVTKSGLSCEGRRLLLHENPFSSDESRLFVRRGGVSSDERSLSAHTTCLSGTKTGHPGFSNQGAQNFWFWLPPPVERHVNVDPAQSWQYVVGSVVPAAGAAAMSAAAQLRKQ